MVQITPLLSTISILSQFTPPDSTSNGLAVRQSIGPNSLPPACQSPCQVVTTLINCASSSSCKCTSTIGSQLEQCLNCLVSSDPAIQTEAQTVINDWNKLCNGNLSLSGGSTSGTTGGSTTASTVPATTTSTSSSSGSSSNPLGTNLNSAVDLKTGSMAVCIVTALAGAFMSF